MMNRTGMISRGMGFGMQVPPAAPQTFNKPAMPLPPATPQTFNQPPSMPVPKPQPRPYGRSNWGFPMKGY